MNKKWILEGYAGTQNLLRIELKAFPFTIGRDAQASLSLPVSEVSRQHAVFKLTTQGLLLHDLNSTNGTFINGQPLRHSQYVKHGDVIHFATQEWRVLEETQAAYPNAQEITLFSRHPLENRLPKGLQALQDLLQAKAISCEYQPIVELDGHLYAYELLTRGNLPSLPRNPSNLFRIAETRPDMAIELSRLMRRQGIAQAYRQGLDYPLFLNTHPAELADLEGLLAEIQQLRQSWPQTRLVLEIHENAVTDCPSLKRFAQTLCDLNVSLAYDDFGAGQARLLELVDVPVEYVKFDISLIRDLPRAPRAKRYLVASLANMTRSLGIHTLAEGIETQAELELCKTLGFDLAQGYYFSPPAPHLDYPTQKGY